MMKDSKGKLFYCEGKIKFLKKLGDMRVYCEKQKSSTNQSLYIPRLVEYDSHKAAERQKKHKK